LALVDTKFLLNKRRQVPQPILQQTDGLAKLRLSTHDSTIAAISI